MRIIAGEFRGRPIRAPKGDGTRPTTDRVRESLMSMLISARGDLEDAVVLDAFAGSGALGLEALSRGARCACFCERDGDALRALNANAEALGLDSRRARIRRCDVLKDPPVSVRQPFDLVLLDPPYALEASAVLGLVDALRARGALAEGALVVYEHAATSNDAVEYATKACDLSLARRKKYGDTVVDVMRASTSLGAADKQEREQDHS